jgi:hypothetical protein
VSKDEGCSGTCHHVFRPEQLITKVEDVANSCSMTTTLFSKRIWVWFWTTIKSWQTSTLVFKVFLSVIAMGGV